MCLAQLYPNGPIEITSAFEVSSRRYSQLRIYCSMSTTHIGKSRKIVLGLFRGLVITAAVFISIIVKRKPNSIDEVITVPSFNDSFGQDDLTVFVNDDTLAFDTPNYRYVDSSSPGQFSRFVVVGNNETTIFPAAATTNRTVENSYYNRTIHTITNDELQYFGVPTTSNTKLQLLTHHHEKDIPTAASDKNEGDTCRIYMAPSTIPGAGYGLFAGVSYEKGDLVTPGDGVVPIYDLVFHNGNEDHVTTFLWDEYVWSGATFSAMTELDITMEAASFGIGALPNCFFPLLNVEDSVRHGRDHANLDVSTSPGIGAFTPWYDRKSYAIQNIHLGSELFVDYGYDYFAGGREETIGLVPFLKHYKIADAILEQLNQITHRILSNHSSNNTTTMDRGATRRTTTTTTTTATTLNHLMEDVFQLARTVLATWPTRMLNAFPNNSTQIATILQNGGTAKKDYQRSIRNLDYLKHSGTCMDHLHVQPSQLIPEAGRGVYTTRSFPKGSVVTTVPLIHIPNRNVMTMYAEAKPVIGNHVRQRNESQPIHQQLLLNYCFGHHESTLLVCPYGIVSALINHAPAVVTVTTTTQLSDQNPTNTGSPKPTANVQIHWSTKFTRSPEWWNMSLSEWAYQYRAGLAFEYVAIRDIEADEEIFLDYGMEWQQAWDDHVLNWNPQERFVDTLNQDMDSIIPTEQEWTWHAGDINTDPQAVNLWCYNAYRELQGLPETDAEAYPCKVVHRYRNSSSGSSGSGNDAATHTYLYTAELIERRQNIEHDVCDEVLDEVLWSLPRDAFVYGGYYEAYDTRQYLMPESFRHDIRIPNHIMPLSWKNLPSTAGENS
jgi:hypothetical protein